MRRKPLYWDSGLFADHERRIIHTGVSMMSGTITGCVLNAATGEALSTPQISLTGTGVIGETFTNLDELGRFAFRPLPPGRYCLGVHHDCYAPVYHNIFLEVENPVADLQIPLTSAAFIKGRILDEDGLPPQRCHFTLIRVGKRGERSGYISDSGDHEVDEDGRFSSPPLHPGRYSLRFAGILRKPPGPHLQSTDSAVQQRIFDFLYPNAQDVTDADSFNVQTGEIVHDLDLRIPRPIWRSVRGKVTGKLPKDSAHIFVHFVRDVGMLDSFGSSGVKVDSSGAFEGLVQPGRYRLSVWEMTPPNQEGYTRMTKEFASTEVMIPTHDVDGVEIQI
ncbi:carboxypeptidase regulatory-like domain-containing protein [Granulicella sp. WH15]|uniref:carboxypeptidase-like regulatory domain-containing protein n=1 Tax=Granulicella sp. WH15 TaxID=2602070 RepID=UPI001366EB70|nr:carboxypeptidase-like regulatory domain-containing protein [Granulicella sp. WH15]QHN04764.1 carboxypeptidase regulatory-like domain-containing protein [Granulicella sp. WH15]